MKYAHPFHSYYAVQRASTKETYCRHYQGGYYNRIPSKEVCWDRFQQFHVNDYPFVRFDDGSLALMDSMGDDRPADRCFYKDYNVSIISSYELPIARLNAVGLKRSWLETTTNGTRSQQLFVLDHCTNRLFCIRDSDYQGHTHTTQQKKETYKHDFRNQVPNGLDYAHAFWRKEGVDPVTPFMVRMVKSVRPKGEMLEIGQRTKLMAEAAYALEGSYSWSYNEPLCVDVTPEALACETSIYNILKRGELDFIYTNGSLLARVARNGVRFIYPEYVDYIQLEDDKYGA